MVYKYITYIIYTYTKTYIYIYIYSYSRRRRPERRKPQTPKKEVGKMVASLALFRPFVQKERDRGKQRNKNKPTKKKRRADEPTKQNKQTKTLSLKTDHQRKMYLTIKTTYVRINQIKLD